MSELTLGQKQELFSKCWGMLLQYAYKHGYSIRHGEVFRPKEMAEIYAAQGKGIKNSLHTKKLAGDLFATKGGEGMWDRATYAPLGAYWKSLHPLCCWGGDFARRDPYHFSITHGGVK